ncbi:putative transporter MCH2 [Paramyrothecium foliicola]|nr:putative transporter MCH2 [Paramyrothecium foliicola]
MAAEKAVRPGSETSPNTSESHNDKGVLSSAADVPQPANVEANHQSTAATPPDGGYGWVCTAAVCTINAHTWGLNSSYGVFLAHYLSTGLFPGATSLEYAFVGSLSISCALLVSPFATISVRQFGTKPTMLIGVVLESASLICASFASKIWHLFLTQGVMFGVGMGFLFVPSVAIVPQWFLKRRSLANGISTSGSGLGGLLYSLATGAMIRNLGLAWAFRILGILAFVVNLVCTIIIKDRNKAVGTRQVAFDMSLFKRPEYLLLLAFGWFSILGYIVLIFSLASYANYIGLDASDAALVSAMINLGQAVGRPLIGFFSDRTGRINMAAFTTFLTGVFALAIWTNSKTYGVLILFAIVGGAVAGTFWTVIGPIAAEVVGLRHVPSALNLTWLSVLLPATFSEPIALQIVEGTGRYLGTQLFTGFMFLAAAICLVVLRGWKIGEVNEIARLMDESSDNIDPVKIENDEELSARRMEDKDSQRARDLASEVERVYTPHTRFAVHAHAMWLLENNEAFNGRRLWLRPGKTYLFGRTAAEPGQLAISHNTISRKHLTITVYPVAEGQAHDLARRSHLTIEDLATKIGTTVNGQKIKGVKYVVETTEAEIVMGKCPSKFHLSWFPVVLSFAFTTKELQSGPLHHLRERFEQLDVKLLTDYNTEHTTHVVSKKRNTAKGLQALINGKFIVTESFLNALVTAAEISDSADNLEPSALEQDFNKHWPDALQHLPPRGGEPVQHPDAIYSPDPDRRDIFDGYTFIFYEESQHDNLLAAITNGSGKGLLEKVTPGKTRVEDFVGYVKNVAGEKGLGRFEDGSEGKGVVLVRYLPAKGPHVDWYTQFITAVSLSLDHRPIEQSEFLEAILTKDASILRRPLQLDSQDDTVARNAVIDQQLHSQRAAPSTQQPSGSRPGDESQPSLRHGRSRRPVKRRFAGFDDDVEIDMDDSEQKPPADVKPVLVDAEEEGGLFVSQEPEAYEIDRATDADRSQRKRKAAPVQDDLMEGVVPAADRLKRQRLARGEELPPLSPDADPDVVESTKKMAPPKKIKKELDILAVAAQNREAEEARARAEKDDLALLPDDVDLSEIRRLNIVEEMELRQPTETRTREQDIADGRWNPKWNGIKNFKKFRQRGEVAGRQPARTIVPLTQVKIKEFGVGDDYWLDDGDNHGKKKTTSQPSVQTAKPSPPLEPPSRSRARPVVQSESDEDGEDGEDGEGGIANGPSATSARAGGSRTSGTANPSQRETRSQDSGARSTRSSQSKRSAPEPVQPQPAKRQRQARKITEIADSDDSDDELKFRFGKRR